MASSSRSGHGNRRFINEDAEAAYEKFKDCKITPSETLILSRISHPISDFFTTSSLIFFLSLAVPFHSEMLYEFFANLLITSDRKALQTRVNYIDISITDQDLVDYLHISNQGPKAHSSTSARNFCWSTANQVLRNNEVEFHVNTCSDLTTPAKVVQHVIRNSLLPKAGDRSIITPLISTVTYYILSHTPFNVVDLIFRNLEIMNGIRDKSSKKRLNLGYGHLIAYILEKKFNITHPMQPDILPTYFNDRSFALYFSRRRRRTANVPSEEEEEHHEEQPTLRSLQNQMTEMRNLIQEFREDTSRRLDALEEEMRRNRASGDDDDDDSSF